MEASDVLREIMRIKNVKPTELAASLNIKNNVLSERFRQENISITKLDEMLKVLNYRVVIVPDEIAIPQKGFLVDSAFRQYDTNPTKPNQTKPNQKAA